MDSINFTSSAVSSYCQRILQIGLLVEKYYTPFLCLLGAFGNSLSLLVFCKDSEYRKHSSAYYLSALAISDTGFLLNVFSVWLESVIGGVITSGLTCPLVMYLGQVTCFVSVYLTVGFSLERYIAIKFPFSRPRICTISKAKKIILLMVVFALVVFSYALFIAKVVTIQRTSMSASNSTGNEIDLEKVHRQERMNEMLEIESNLEDIQTNVSTKHDLEIGTVSELLVPQKNGEILDSNVANRNICTVPEDYYKISEIANYLDSLITLIIPFFLITFFNVKISKSLGIFMNEAEKIEVSDMKKVNQDKLSVPPAGKSSQVIKVNVEINKKHRPNETFELTTTLALTDCELQSTMSIDSRQSINDSKVILTRDNTFKNLQQQNGKISNAGTKFRVWQQRQLRSHLRVTKTLLLVSTVFIILNLPMHVIRCSQFIQAASGYFKEPEIFEALQPWAHILFNTNFAVNFLLYCMSGSNFRQSLRSIIISYFKQKGRFIAQPEYI